MTDLSSETWDAIRALRDRPPHPDDQPDPTVITDAIDRDGMVLRVRGLSWEEQLALIERACIGEVG